MNFESEIADFLYKNPVGVLATINEHGYPRTVPIHFFYKDKNLYWFSDEDSEHSQSIGRHRNPYISITIYSTDKNSTWKAANFRTYSEICDDEEAEKVVEYFQEKFIHDQERAKGFDYLKVKKLYRASIGDFDGEKSNGGCKYFQHGWATRTKGNLR